MDIPARNSDNPFKLRAVARRACDDLLRANCVERFQTLSQETLLWCLLDNCDEILSNGDWLEGDWDLDD